MIKRIKMQEEVKKQVINSQLHSYKVHSLMNNIEGERDVQRLLSTSQHVTIKITHPHPDTHTHNTHVLVEHGAPKQQGEASSLLVCWPAGRKEAAAEFYIVWAERKRGWLLSG